MVARRAPPARVERRTPVYDSQEDEGGLGAGDQRSVECGGTEDEAGGDASLSQMGAEGREVGGADGGVPSQAGDQDALVPGGTVHGPGQFEEIAALGLGQARVAMDPEVGHRESRLAQLAPDEDLQGLRR